MERTVRPDLAPHAAAHLHRLMAEWQLLADLCFADLLLFVPHPGGFRVLGQVRPATARTLHPEDLVGEVVSASWHPYVERAWREQRRIQSPEPVFIDAEAVRVQAVPVQHGGVVAVLSVEAAEYPDRPTGRLETAYLRSGDALLDMVDDGSFPAPQAAPPDSPTRLPRVGDGLLTLDHAGRVSFASPNASSNFRRLGLSAPPVGERLPERFAGLVAAATAAGRPVPAEVEAGGCVVVFEAIPLRTATHAAGTMLLCREITELRRLDRALLRREAMIREVHHRVKNNLQTVASLLRLQGRRLGGQPEAAAALEESVRRVASIALVHETLTEEFEGAVDLGGVTRRVVRMLEGTLGRDGVRLEVRAEQVVVPAEVATPIALVIAELVQNAVVHGLGPAGGEVTVRLRVSPDDRLALEVTDAAAEPGAAPDGYRDGLGLRLVRALAEGELGGRFDLRLRAGLPGVAQVVVPLRGAAASAQADSASPAAAAGRR